jgi:ZIP family zinc transporter
VLYDFYAARGFDLFAMDNTACGASFGQHFGYDTYESEDALRWIDFLRETFGEDIALILHGFSLGASTVLFARGELNRTLQRALTGFAAGVMVAASIWSLIIPAIEQSQAMGKLAFVPAFVGFWLGILFLLLLDSVLPHLHLGAADKQPEGLKSRLQRTTLMVLAVTIHNIPEGMAVGIVYAGWLSGQTGITLSGAIALSLGIAIQNFPEGAIISLPLRAEGSSRTKAFLGGFLSGVVEPVGALLTIIAAQHVVPFLPYFLSFAAGAMMYVVVEELIPEASEGEHSNIGVIMFALGFTVMMALDVGLA